MGKKELPELPDKEVPEPEESVILKVVPDDFPIESYINGDGNKVICIRDSEYKARILSQQLDTASKVENLEKIMK